jgi:hypothetical protein
MGRFYHFLNVWDDEGAVCAGGVVETKLFVFILSVGDVPINFSAVESGYSWTNMGLRHDKKFVAKQ